MSATRYLGHGETAATVLRRAAQQGRVHLAPMQMIARFEAAADVVAHTGELPAWAQPTHPEKNCRLCTLREDEAE